MTVFADHWSQRGCGVWAVTDKTTGQFIGHCGLNFVSEAGEVEVLYALRQDSWGQGLATEAARASVRFGFEQADLARLIALAVPENSASLNSSQTRVENCNKILIDLGGKRVYTVSYTLVALGRVMARVRGRAAM